MKTIEMITESRSGFNTPDMRSGGVCDEDTRGENGKKKPIYEEEGISS